MIEVISLYFIRCSLVRNKFSVFSSFLYLFHPAFFFNLLFFLKGRRVQIFNITISSVCMCVIIDFGEGGGFLIFVVILFWNVK
jgi:hypothetical protein